jgi:hypothetical protein
MTFDLAGLDAIHAQAIMIYSITDQALMTIGSQVRRSCRDRGRFPQVSFDHQMAVRSVIDPHFVQIEFVVDADAQEIVGDAGIEGRGPRIRGRRCDGEG